MHLFEHSVRCGEGWRLGGVFSHPGQAASGSDGAGSLVGICFQTGVMCGILMPATAISTPSPYEIVSCTMSTYTIFTLNPTKMCAIPVMPSPKFGRGFEVTRLCSTCG